MNSHQRRKARRARYREFQRFYRGRKVAIPSYSLTGRLGPPKWEHRAHRIPYPWEEGDRLRFLIRKIRRGERE